MSVALRVKRYIVRHALRAHVRYMLLKHTAAASWQTNAPKTHTIRLRPRGKIKNISSVVSQLNVYIVKVRLFVLKFQNNAKENFTQFLQALVRCGGTACNIFSFRRCYCRTRSSFVDFTREFCANECEEVHAEHLKYLLLGAINFNFVIFSFRLIDSWRI